MYMQVAESTEILAALMESPRSSEKLNLKEVELLRDNAKEDALKQSAKVGLIKDQIYLLNKDLEDRNFKWQRLVTLAYLCDLEIQEMEK